MSAQTESPLIFLITYIIILLFLGDFKVNPHNYNITKKLNIRAQVIVV